MNIPARVRSLTLIVVLLLVFAFPSSAQAQGIVYGDTVPAGTVVEYDVVLIGQNVVLDGAVNGNVFILGNQVTLNGTVDGSLVLIGQNAVIAGTVTGAVYASALTLELAPGAYLARELYVVTVSLVTHPASSVGRDLFAVSLDAGLNGEIGRTPHTAIGPIQLYNGLMTLLGFDELTIRLHIDFPPPTDEPGAGARVPSAPHVRARPAAQEALPFDWNAWTIARLRDWAVLAVFALLAFALARPALDRGSQPLLAHPFRTAWTGVIALVIAVNLFGVAALLAALIFSIGLGLNFIGLWQLSIALWIASYSALALILVGLWLLLVYGTKILVLYLLTAWLLAKTGPSAAWLNALTLAAATLLFVLLQSVPYVGWVFDVLVTAAGLGAVWHAYRAGRRTPPAWVVAPSAAPVRVPAVSRTKGTSTKKS